jgi:hypothetical protein
VNAWLKARPNLRAGTYEIGIIAAIGLLVLSYLFPEFIKQTDAALVRLGALVMTATNLLARVNVPGSESMVDAIDDGEI